MGNEARNLGVVVMTQSLVVILTIRSQNNWSISWQRLDSGWKQGSKTIHIPNADSPRHGVPSTVQQ